MFDAIARRYDTLNHLLSAGLDRRWRRRAVRELRLTGRERVLDVCTGTADLAIGRRRGRTARPREVVGIDFAGEMLASAARRCARAASRRACASRAATRRGCRCRDASCDAAMVAFGIRNVVDPVARVPGIPPRAAAGRPARRSSSSACRRCPASRRLYRLVLSQCCRASAGSISRHRDAYDYLPASVAAISVGAGLCRRAAARRLSSSAAVL